MENKFTINTKEVWKDVKKYEGHYLISNNGNVKSLKNNGERILKAGRCSGGYYTVVLCVDGITTTKRVHQLVAESFLGNNNKKNKMVVDHIDANKLNNNVINLQFISNRENCSKDKKGYSSKYVGVHFCKTNKKWGSMIRLGKIRKNLGLFSCELSAHIAYENELKLIG